MRNWGECAKDLHNLSDLRHLFVQTSSSEHFYFFQSSKFHQIDKSSFQKRETFNNWEFAGEIQDSVDKPIWSAKSCFSFHHRKYRCPVKNTLWNLKMTWDWMSKLIISDEDLLTFLFLNLMSLWLVAICRSNRSTLDSIEIWSNFPSVKKLLYPKWVLGRGILKACGLTLTTHYSITTRHTRHSHCVIAAFHRHSRGNAVFVFVEWYELL